MKDYYEEYSSYFKEYEYVQENKDFFKEEINSVLNYLYDEINYTKKFIRFKNNGIEINYLHDLSKFEKDIEKYRYAFKMDSSSAKIPQRLSRIFATQYNYLTHLNIREKTINEIFEVIREDLFELKKAPSIGRAKEELIENLFSIDKAFNEMSTKWEKLVSDNPKLSLEKLIEKFTIENSK